MIMKTYLMYVHCTYIYKTIVHSAGARLQHYNNRSPFEVVNTCQPHRVHIVALQVKYLLCAKATTRECVGRVAECEKLLARKLPVLQYSMQFLDQNNSLKSLIEDVSFEPSFEGCYVSLCFESYWKTVPKHLHMPLCLADRAIGTSLDHRWRDDMYE